MPYHLWSRVAVDGMLGYDTDMITVKWSRGFQGEVGYAVMVYGDGAIILAISPSLLVVLLLMSEYSPLHHAAPWLEAT